MKKLQSQKGFTLVELAIVMTIIGLLIGGILKGQELMQNARVTATIAQVRSYEAATTTFRDTYAAIPGDMPNAQNRIPGCTVNCNPASGVGLAGNTFVGAPGWGTGGFTAQVASATAAMNVPPSAVGDETVLYWAHLLLADLIAGVSNAALNGSVPSWGDTHPQARIGGGFIVGWGDGTIGPGSTATAGTGPAGMLLALVQGPTTGGTAAMQVAGQQPLTPARAAQIDRKMDDGRPTGGFVQAYGVTANCFTTGSTSANAAYVESSTVNSCGLLFRIQG